MPKSGTAAHARTPGSVVREWHGCHGAAFAHTIIAAAACTMLAYSMLRSRAGLRSSDDAAGDTHAMTRAARGTGARIAAVLHASDSSSSPDAARTWTRASVVVSPPASTARKKSRCSKTMRAFIAGRSARPDAAS
eukprot:scaffold13744_cov63-Phaeocystis_antarctica.AAC.3